MPDQTQDALPAAPQADDPFDLGNTDLVLPLGDSSPKNAPKPDEADPSSPVIVAPERPRNPDGTFSAFKKELEPAPPVSKHPSYLIEAATDFGYSEEEIEEMSPALLHKTIWNHKRRLDHERQQAVNFRTQDAARVRPPEPTPEPEPDEFDLGLDNEADYDPKIIGALKKLSGNAKEVKALKAQLAQRDQRDQQRDTLRTAAMIDAAFAALPEYKKIFGEGTGSALADKPEMARRIAVLRQANIDMNQIGSVHQLKAKIKQATDLIYAPVLTPPANPYEEPRNGRISPEDWDAGGLAKPTGRKAKDLPKGDALAVAQLTKRMKDAGEVIPDSEELDGFPD